MRIIDQMERKFGKFAIKNLMLYISVLSGVIYILMYLDQSGMFGSQLILIPAAVLQGQIWRLFTFVLIPPSAHPIFILFVLFFYYRMGLALEHEWGSFRFNLFYFLGMMITIIAAFLTNNIATSIYLNLSIFLAFAHLFPNFTIMLFFVLPLKIKYLAWFQLAYLTYVLIMFPMSHKIFVIASLLNYAIFFGKDIFSRTRNTSSAIYRKQAYHRSIYVDREKPFHRCEVCGRTEKDDLDLEFRICATCEGKHEYCMEHLLNHEHVVNNENHSNS